MHDVSLSEHDESTFASLFDTDDKCLQFLASYKWRDGYSCRKCGNSNYCPGRTPYSRRCTRCKHDESARVATVFEGCRFQLPKAFAIAYDVCHSSGLSAIELSRKLELRQMTCWAFKKRLLECLESSDQTHDMFSSFLSRTT